MKIGGLEATVNPVYFYDIKFLLLLEDVEHLVLMKWVIRKSKLRTEKYTYQQRKVFSEVSRTTQKASFDRACSQLLHTKTKIKDHDPVKWEISFSNGILKYRPSTVNAADPVLLKVIGMFS